MTTDRIGAIPRVPKGECRHCRGAVPQGRRTFCSQRCVTDALIQKGDPLTVRREVFGRDRGICSDCGMDTDQVARVIRYLTKWDGLARLEDRQLAREAARWLYAVVTGRRGLHGHLWEADHVVPVVEGGGGCGLDGYRTLCLQCHARVTAELARRRAAERRQQKAAARLAAWTGKAASV